MEDLGAEERELRRLGGADLGHEPRRGHDARVRREDSVHVVQISMRPTARPASWSAAPKSAAE